MTTTYAPPPDDDDDDGPDLPGLRAVLDDAITQLDTLVELLPELRHATEDPARRDALSWAVSDLGTAWAWARRGATTLAELDDANSARDAKTLEASAEGQNRPQEGLGGPGGTSGHGPGCTPPQWRPWHRNGARCALAAGNLA